MYSHVSYACVVALLSWRAAAADSLKDIDHVVLFMQENRAFDHYFGTMAGVRGFADPNVHYNNNRSVFHQDVNSTLTNKTDTLLPFYLNYLGGNWSEATQCLIAGNNGWDSNHGALNADRNNKWALANTPWSWGYFKRADLPVHFAIAEGWTVGDMYQESVIASTNPNRVTWISGSINAPGSPQAPSEGGIVIDNNETPGCEGPDLNCYPTTWKTVPEYYQDAGVSWQVYQDTDNFDDNPLAWFKQFQEASNASALGQRGMAYVGLEKFYADAAAGTLPQVSYIIGPAELSEHPPYQPRDGAWLQRKVVEAVVNGKNYKNTALIISYDESGGLGDHVVPYHSPNGTAGEWIEDPYNEYGYVYTGPGFRLPFYIVSPWTRGGNVYTENADHVSQIKFVEKWLKAKGYNNVETSQVPAWRRQNMADLTNAFDFNHPDYSIPVLPNISAPSVDGSGQYNGYSLCQAKYPHDSRPPVPYGEQSEASALATEQGFKAVRGQLTEGRFLVFEKNGFALASPSFGSSSLTATRASPIHDIVAQRWILHQLKQGGNQFTLESVSTSKCAAGLSNMSPCSQTAPITINDLGNGQGHTLQVSNGEYLSINKNGKVVLTSKVDGFQLFSVTYS
ncbi:phosphoesterase-domain-containing protein, partial [Aureobasidium melanogenum]